MTHLKTAARFVTDYLPQIFMALILIAALSLAKLPAEAGESVAAGQTLPAAEKMSKL